MTVHWMFIIRCFEVEGLQFSDGFQPKNIIMSFHFIIQIRFVCLCINTENCYMYRHTETSTLTNKQTKKIYGERFFLWFAIKRMSRSNQWYFWIYSIRINKEYNQRIRMSNFWTKRILCPINLWVLRVGVVVYKNIQ